VKGTEAISMDRYKMCGKQSENLVKIAEKKSALMWRDKMFYI